MLSDAFDWPRSASDCCPDFRFPHQVTGLETKAEVFSNCLQSADMETSSLDLFLEDLDERKGRIPSCEEFCLIQRRVRKVVKTILLEVRRENPFFVSTLVNSGSFYEGTKVGKPDEFDFFICLDAFSSPEDIKFKELPCSTVYVLPSESACRNIALSFADGRSPWPLPSSTENMTPSEPPCDPRYFQHYDFMAFEWKKNIKTPFFELLYSKARGFEAYGMKVVTSEPDEIVKAPPSLSKHGPAYTLQLEWNGGELEPYKGLRISVDLALAVKINSRPNINLQMESPTGRVLNSLLDSFPYFYAVGSYRNVLTEVHPNFFEDSEQKLQIFKPINFCLRCSQSWLEQALFCQKFGRKSGQSKCLRLLKVLRDIFFPDPENEDMKIADTDNMTRELGLRLSFRFLFPDDVNHATKLVSSYILKTLVLFEWQKNPGDDLWSGSHLSERLLNILRSLVAHLEEKKLTSFFYADYNLFQTTIPDEDYPDAASIINIVLNRLESIKTLPEYSFEACLGNIEHDFEIICRKKKLTSLLSDGLWDRCFDNVFFQSVVEKSLRNEGKGEIYDEHEPGKRTNPIEAARKVIEELIEIPNLLEIYVQSLLDQIAPEETLILTRIKVKDRESLSNAVKQFEEFTRGKMAQRDNLPSYDLWSQQHWRIEESAYKLTSDKPKKLLQFVLTVFQEDIKTFLDELMERF